LNQMPAEYKCRALVEPSSLGVYHQTFVSEKGNVKVHASCPSAEPSFTLLKHAAEWRCVPHILNLDILWRLVG
jgi:hypothetical protein